MVSLTLKHHNSFQNNNNRKATPSFASRPLFFKSQQVWKFNNNCVSWGSAKTDLVTNFLNLENRSFENGFSKFKKFVTRSFFGELQLTQISLNFQATCYNFKIRGLVAKLCVAFFLFLFWKELWHFKVKERVHTFCWTKI